MLVESRQLQEQEKTQPQNHKKCKKCTCDHLKIFAQNSGSLGCVHTFPDFLLSKQLKTISLTYLQSSNWKNRIFFPNILCNNIISQSNNDIMTVQKCKLDRLFNLFIAYKIFLFWLHMY